MPADEVYKPSFLSDPVGVIADYAFRSKIAIEDRPFQTLGAVGAVALGALYFGGPMLMEAGGGGTVGMTPLAAAAGAASPASAATMGLGSTGAVEWLFVGARALARIGGTVTVAKVASNGIGLAKASGTGSGNQTDPDKKRKEKR